MRLGGILDFFEAIWTSVLISQNTLPLCRKICGRCGFPESLDKAKQDS
jgi:hypothetical protein